MLLTYPFHFFQHVHPLAESKKSDCYYLYANSCTTMKYLEILECVANVSFT